MKIKYVCPFWGSERLTAQAFIEKVSSSGYGGIEINMPVDPDYWKNLRPLAEQYGLDVIAQQWLDPIQESPVRYLKRLEKRLYQLAELNPIFINSHTGRDYFTFSENSMILERIFRFEEETGIEVYHETHRGRFNFSAVATERYIKNHPGIKFTADLSHWVLVSESFLEDQKEALSLLIANSRYIHARFGDTQRSQIDSPFDESNMLIRKKYLAWWKDIVKHRMNLGAKSLHICPEFGPKPYLNDLNRAEDASQVQWKLNEQCKDYLLNNLGEANIEIT